MEPLEFWEIIDESHGADELKRYLALGGSVNFVHPEIGWGFLHLACETDNLLLISELIFAGASPEAIPPCGYPAIFQALDGDIDGPIQNESEMTFPVTRHLIENGALVDVTDEKGRTLREAALGYGVAAQYCFDEKLGELIASKTK